MFLILYIVTLYADNGSLSNEKQWWTKGRGQEKSWGENFNFSNLALHMSGWRTIFGPPNHFVFYSLHLWVYISSMESMSNSNPNFSVHFTRSWYLNYNLGSDKYYIGSFSQILADLEIILGSWYPWIKLRNFLWKGVNRNLWNYTIFCENFNFQ